MTGIVFAAVLFSAFLHASWNFLSKRTAGDFTVMWLSIVMWSLLSLPVFLYFLVSGGFDGRSLVPLLVSVLAHGSYFITLTAAYRSGDISTAYPIARGIGVAGTGLIGIFALRETVPLAGGAGISLVVTGVLLIGTSGLLRRGHARTFGLAILTGAGTVAYTVADKFGVVHTNPFLYLGLLNLGSAVLTAPLVLRRGRAALGACWRAHRLRILLISFGSGLTYLLILWVMRIERVGYIAAVRESSVVIAVLLGRIFLKERIGYRKAAGILCILAGLVSLRA